MFYLAFNGHEKVHFLSLYESVFWNARKILKIFFSGHTEWHFISHQDYKIL
jgi:hypothetical protein